MDQQPEQRGQQQTGDAGIDAGIDAALARLADLDERPVDEHVAVLEQAHAALRDALSRPVPTAPSA